MAKRFATFADFYPYYLSEQSSRACRWLHFVGTTGDIGVGLYALSERNGWWLLLVPVVSYGFAWAGHFFLERNTPATFRHPFYSLIADFVMYKDILIGRVKM